MWFQSQRILLPSLVLICLAAVSCSRVPPGEEDQQILSQTLVEPGVSSELADLRASTISELSYEIFLSIPSAVEMCTSVSSNRGAAIERVYLAEAVPHQGAML